MLKVIGLLAAAALVTSATVLPVDEGATVANFGRDGLTCAIVGPFGTGEGQATYVETKDGKINYHCNGQIDDATLAPDKAFRGGLYCGFAEGEIVYTPSGNFNGTCKN